MNYLNFFSSIKLKSLYRISILWNLMKTANTNYSFSKKELQILEEIAKGNYALSSIQAALSVTPSLLSYNLNKLQDKGLVKTSKKINRKQLNFNDLKHAALLRDLLLIYDHVDWDNILSGKAIDILLHTLGISEKRIMNIPKNTRWRYMKKLKTRGLITQKGTIGPQFRLLSEFLKEYQTFFANKLAKTISENSIILWQQGMEFLIRPPKSEKPPLKNFFKTSTSLFPQHDLPLLTEFDIYLYSTTKKSIKPEDAILHTLLVGPDNVRYTTYALLLLKKTEKQIDKAYLLQEAERYGFKKQMNGMLRFLETHIRLEGQPLPTWEEFAVKAEDYGVIP